MAPWAPALLWVGAGAAGRYRKASVSTRPSRGPEVARVVRSGRLSLRTWGCLQSGKTPGV